MKTKARKASVNPPEVCSKQVLFWEIASLSAYVNMFKKKKGCSNFHYVSRHLLKSFSLFSFDNVARPQNEVMDFNLS